MIPYTKDLRHYARELRINMTDAERYLWSKIRMKQLKNCQFYRQRIIGAYIVDFYCPQMKLVIEVDGGQHYYDETIVADKIRSEYLKARGLHVFRFSNLDVLNNIDGVISTILEYMD